MKTIIRCIFYAFLCFAASAVAAENHAPAGFNAMLRGANVGVTFSDFVAAHPEAVYSDEDKRSLPVTPEQPAALLITHASDPFLGLSSFADIGFKDGCLYELVSVWTGAEDKVHMQRRRFFSAIIQRHGHAYTHETILVHPHTLEERPVAVFLWHEKDAAILAFYTNPSPLAPHPKSTLTYALFSPDDPFLNDIMAKRPATDEQREQAWAVLADIMPLREALK